MTVPAESSTSEAARADPGDAPSGREGVRPERASAAPNRRLPDFFIVGHPKCGTTALHEMLRQHPQIHMPLKEPRFFSLELRSRFRRLGPGTLPLTLDRYLALFDGARPEQRLGEASPQYLRSQVAAGEIARACPDARIIAILREPASFLRSFHLQALHNLNETEPDFAKALALEPARREGRKLPLLAQSPQALMYSEHVRYAEQLRRLHDVFPAEQVLVLIYDDFRRENDATVRRVLRFLDVDDAVVIEPVQTSQLPLVRSPSLYRLTRALALVRSKLTRGSAGARSRRVLPQQRRAATLAWRRVLFAPQQPPDERFMVELRSRLKPEVIAISEYLGRDLVGEWGYEDV